MRHHPRRKYKVVGLTRKQVAQNREIWLPVWGVGNVPWQRLIARQLMIRGIDIENGDGSLPPQFAGTVPRLS